MCFCLLNLTKQSEHKSIHRIDPLFCLLNARQGGWPASVRLADDDPLHGSTAKMAAASPPPLLLRLLTLALALAGATAGKISGPRTPISRDIYHSR